MTWVTLLSMLMIFVGNIFGLTHMHDTVREGRLRNRWGDLWHYPLLMLAWTFFWFWLLSVTLIPR